MSRASGTGLTSFYDMSPRQRDDLLLEEIRFQHHWHYQRNSSYRATLSLRGVGPEITEDHIHRLLRVSAISFKSYIEQLGTPFPQDRPREFVQWILEQISIPPCETAPLSRVAKMIRANFRTVRRSYRNLEALLCDVERLFEEAGIEIVTSSGTSGTAAILLRDSSSKRIATEAYFAAIEHAWGIKSDHNLIFVMPHQTRVAMARIARMATHELGWAERNRILYTMPFSATPDIIRIRMGRLFRTGLKGMLEQSVLHPFMEWANERLAEKKYIRATVGALEQYTTMGKPLLLLGGLVQLDSISRFISDRGGMSLPQGSRIATGGGMKQLYWRTPAEIRSDLERAFRVSDGTAAPVTDIYGMAEGNWAAFQCTEGNYHLPPWLYVSVMDDDDNPLAGNDITGLLAFWDPFGGGRVYPPFFQTADRVRLINANRFYDPQKVCDCGDRTSYIKRESIQRVDLMEEAGCGATI